jgi:glycosyltransferase EpsD
MNKVLFCATVDYHFKAFHLPVLKWFKEQGWDVHIAASGTVDLPFVDKKFNIPIQRSPFHQKNIKAFQSLKTIINENNYRIIHCHTPMGGVLTRLAARTARKTGTRVLYTAHGFHFCKGSPLLNWIIYYPIEKLLSLETDCLITINSEDYNRAIKHHFKANKIKYVPGVGVDIKKFNIISQNENMKIRKELGYKEEEFLLFYAAEFNKNKNQQFLIKMIEKLRLTIPNVRLLLAGEGGKLNECKKLVDHLGLNKYIDFLGYQTDIPKLLGICDVVVASSLREGLPVNLIEAMASGKPIVAKDNRGHRELVKHNLNGFLIKNVEDGNRFLESIYNSNCSKKMGLKSKQLVRNYSLDRVIKEISFIYKQYM